MSDEKVDIKKALLDAQKQGYKMHLKNGATARFFLPNSPKIQRTLKTVFESMSNDWIVTTSILEAPVGKRRIYLIYAQFLTYREVIRDIMKAHFEQNLSSIAYEGRVYVPTERTGQILLTAIAKNVAPNLIALMGQK